MIIKLMILVTIWGEWVSQKNFQWQSDVRVLWDFSFKEKTLDSVWDCGLYLKSENW